jgi:DNA mismatch repair protein MutS2
LPAEWLDRAEARLGTEHRDLRRLIAEVDRVRQEVTGLREQLEIEASDAEKLRRRLESERNAMEEERKNVGRRLRTELDAFRRETADRLRQEVEALRERFEEGRRSNLAAEAVETLFAEAPVFEEAEPAAAGPLVVGAPVRHIGLGWQGVLEKLEEGRAEVAVRGKRVRCRPEELAPVEKGAGTLKSAAVEPRPTLARIAAARERPSAFPSLGDEKPGSDLEERPGISPEINLIGQRIEPALEALDEYLDRAILAARREVRVVHGHGTGRLRQAVREHLRSHRAVSEVRSGAPNEGGNGATVAVLRGA